METITLPDNYHMEPEYITHSDGSIEFTGMAICKNENKEEKKDECK